MLDGSAFLSDARMAGVRLLGLARAISALESEDVGKYPTMGANGPQTRSPGLSDPTYASMLSDSARLRRLDWLRRERDGCLDAVGELLAVVAGMRVALGDPTADAIEAYYVDGPATGASWAEIAASQGVTERTVMRRRSVAVDWLSDVGLAHAKAGDLTRGTQAD